jgi:hypothetical protein
MGNTLNAKRASRAEKIVEAINEALLPALIKPISPPNIINPI